MKKHVVITGTGRSGTSFLVQLLTEIGLDTGFDQVSIDKNIDPIGRAGLESDIWAKDAAYVVKSPNISNYIDTVLADPNIQLDQVIIPLRDIEAAANSRSKVSKDNLKARGLLGKLFGSKRGHAGGLIKTSSAAKQQNILLRSLSHLLVECVKHDQPMILLHYPRLTKDPDYLYTKLKPILNSVSLESFRESFHKVVNPDLVSRLSNRDT